MNIGNRNATSTTGTYTPLSDGQILTARTKLDHISALLKEEKRLLTEEFYKDKNPTKMKMEEWRKIQSEFEPLWKEREKTLFKIISGMSLEALTIAKKNGIAYGVSNYCPEELRLENSNTYSTPDKKYVIQSFLGLKHYDYIEVRTYDSLMNYLYRGKTMEDCITYLNTIK